MGPEVHVHRCGNERQSRADMDVGVDALDGHGLESLVE